MLLALHGFNDTARNYMAESAALFTDQGLAVYGYDQRGFGSAPHPGIWPGAESLAADATAAAALLRARHPGLPLWMMGESMGAAVLNRGLTRVASASPSQSRIMAGVQDAAKHAMSAMSPLKSCDVEKPQPQR